MVARKGFRYAALLQQRHTKYGRITAPSFVLRLFLTKQVTRATHVRNRVCPRVELILKIIIILLIRFLGFIKSKQSQTIKMKKMLFPARGLNRDRRIPLCTPFSGRALATELRRLNGLRRSNVVVYLPQRGERLRRSVTICILNHCFS